MPDQCKPALKRSTQAYKGPCLCSGNGDGAGSRNLLDQFKSALKHVNLGRRGRVHVFAPAMVTAQNLGKTAGSNRAST